MYYQLNMESKKLELVIGKDAYKSLSPETQKKIKSNYLFSRRIDGWVSRAQYPRTGIAEAVAKEIGAEYRGKIGEALTFEEEQERKAARAEARAERMDARADKAYAEGKRLQKPIDDMHGDIAFFTQPNISTCGGRAFTNRRNKMFAAWERGFEEFKKSDYYEECARTARKTAENAKNPNDKGFCQRRIAEAEKSIRAINKNRALYEEILSALKSGTSYKTMYGTNYTPDDVSKIESRLEDCETSLEYEISKAVYYHNAIEEMGGIQYSAENIKPGYIVRLSNSLYGDVEVVSCGPKNFTYGEFKLKASYGEIVKVVKATEKTPEQHPFKVGDVFHPLVWFGMKYNEVEAQIVKATSKTVSIKYGDKVVVRKPRNRGNGEWAVFVDDYYKSGCFKNAQ